MSFRMRRLPAKSDAAKSAIGAARAHVRDHGAQPPPAHLRSAAYPGARTLGRGEGYDYPHSRPGHFSEQELMPAGLEGVHFYDPDEAEGRLLERLEEVRKARGRTR